MDYYILVGVASGEYEGNKWGRLYLARPMNPQRGSGCSFIDKDHSKCDYNLAVQLQRDWSLYEGQKVSCSANLYGRIDRCDLIE